MNTKQFFKQYKEGMIIGAIAGFIVAYFILPVDFDFAAMAQTSSMLDVLQGAGTTALAWAKTKVTVFFTVAGAFLGTIVDMVVTK